MVGLSAHYLAQCFHAQYGVTLARYILHCRIERAIMLLQTTQLPVKVIGAQGVCSISINASAP